MTTTTLHRAQTYRLYPTPEQASVLGSWVGAVRAVYNLGLEQRKMWSKSKKVSVNYYTQAKELETFLEYKLQARGGRIIKVQPHYTSQRCAHCGHIDKDSRNKEKFHCTSCHHEDHADLNAAINIHNLGLEFLSLEKKEKSRWDTPEYILRGEASVQTCLRSANHPKIKVTNL